MKRSVLLLILLLALAVGATILYFGVGGGVSDGRYSAARPEVRNGPSGEMMGAMHRMHESVNKIPMTGDLDRDFVALMVPHHQSAVEMAQVYLRHGGDPELRRLSEDIVKSQEAEIRQMQSRGGAPVALPAPAKGDSSSGH
jgi:hypothetical protein